MHDTFVKGQIAVLKCQERALELGYHFCLPTVEARFDAVLVSPSGTMKRAQIKYADNDGGGRYNGSVYLDLRKKTRGEGPAKSYTSSEVDVVLVYMPKIEKVLWLPPEVFDQSKGLMLRYLPALKSGQQCNDAHSFIWNS